MLLGNNNIPDINNNATLTFLFFIFLSFPFLIINLSDINNIAGKTIITTAILINAPLEIKVHREPTISSLE